MDNYTAAGRIDTLTYPSGATLRYLRDSQGRTIGVMGKPTATAAEVSLVTTASYLPFGPLSGLTFGNGRVQTRVFDRNYAADRLFDVAANDGFDIDLSLDVAGNVISLAERQGTNSVLRSVDYDGQNRLTALRDGANLVEGFGYDATGNRTARSTATATTPYTTVPSSHRLQSVGPITRGYDAAGNTTAINDPAPKTLIYNDLGRLREVKLSGALHAGYRYNGRGERIVKLHPTDVNQNRYFVYTDSGQLLGEYNRTGVRIAEYVWLDDTLVAIYSDHDASTYQFVQTDHLGTPRAVVHPSRNRIVWRWDLAGSAFGDHAPVTDPDADGKGFGLNLRYPGQYFDAESGLHYNYFRDYEPSTGRYVESDPYGLMDGPSTFAYVAGSPLNFLDEAGSFRLRAEERRGFDGDKWVFWFDFGNACDLVAAEGALAGGKSIIKKISRAVRVLPESSAGDNDIDDYVEFCRCINADPYLKQRFQQRGFSAAPSSATATTMSESEARNALGDIRKDFNTYIDSNCTEGCAELKAAYPWSDLVDLARERGRTHIGRYFGM